MHDPQLMLDVAAVFPHEEGQQMWWESYARRNEKMRVELVDDLKRRLVRNEGLV